MEVLRFHIPTGTEDCVYEHFFLHTLDVVIFLKVEPLMTLNINKLKSKLKNNIENNAIVSEFANH